MDLLYNNFFNQFVYFCFYSVFSGFHNLAIRVLLLCSSDIF